MTPFWTIFIIVVGFIVIRILIGAMHRSIIRDHFADIGCEVLSVKWDIFPEGWFFEKGSFYEVSYRNARGMVHYTLCRVGVFSGVYCRLDEQSAGSAPPPPPEPPREPVKSVPAPKAAVSAREGDPRTVEVKILLEENHRLREQVARLTRELENR